VTAGAAVAATVSKMKAVRRIGFIKRNFAGPLLNHVVSRAQDGHLLLFEIANAYCELANF
jgi:hypothetical protein